MSSCAVCKNPVTKRKAPGVQCSGQCKLYFHFEKCAKLSSEECDAIEKKRLAFICPPCTRKRSSIVFARRDSVSESEENVNKMSMEGLIETQNELKDNVKRLTEIVEDLNLKITLFDSVIARLEKVTQNSGSSEKEGFSGNKSSANGFSYADIVQNKQPVVVVKPKNSEQNSNETRDHIKSLFDPVVDNINGLKSVAKGGVVIICKDSESTRKCSEEIVTRMGEQYEVSVTKTKVPLIKVWGMSEVLSKEDFVDKIRRQNDCIREDSVINVLNIKENRRGVLSLIEVDEKTHEDLISVGRVYIGWDSCRVYQHIDIQRCFKCNQFGHIANYCKREFSCGNCAEGHESKDCDSEIRKCVNCVYAKETFKIDLDVNHPAYSLKCPAYLKKLQQVTKVAQRGQ
jgi:hypothetical protein